MNIADITLGTIIADQGKTFVILDTRLSLDGTILECIALTTEKDLISYTLNCDSEGTIYSTSFVTIVDNIMGVYGDMRSKLYKKGTTKLDNIDI